MDKTIIPWGSKRSYVLKFSGIRLDFIRALNIAFFFMLFTIAAAANAENSLSQQTVQNYTTILDKTENYLKRHRYDEAKIPDVTKQVTQIKSDATQCIATETENLAKTKADLDSLGVASKVEPIDVKQKRAELKNEIQNTEKLLASCRVFILRSDEILQDLSAEQKKMLSERLFAKGGDFKHLVLKNWNKPSVWIKSIQLFLLNDTGVGLLSASDILGLIIIIFTVLFVSIVVRRHIYAYMDKIKVQDTFSERFSRSLLAVSCFYLPQLLVSASIAIYCYALTAKISPVPFISVVAYGLPIYFTLITVVEIFLRPRKPAISFHGLPEDVAIALARRLKVFLLLLFIGYLLFTTLLTQSLPEETLLLSRGILIFIFVLNLIWAVQLLGKIPRFADTFIIRFSINLVLFIVLVAEFLGYRNLSDYVVFAVFGSLIMIGLFILVSRLLNEFFDGLEKGKRKWQRYIRESLGVKARKKLPELTWIRFFLIAALWLGLLVIILRVWGLSEAGFSQIKIILLDGFTLGSFKIIPARIFFATVLLIILLPLNRWFRTQLETSWLLRTNLDRGAREAVATISGYIGVAIALVISLSITGVEFGNLAIIAGALSVGIGFGLQNIVNNFVSGLILLFERPIKTGDWIVVGSTEGYVKRISIRSTQIQTFDQADVIVPNSDLISGQVTNWMLRDVQGRIRVPIGVAYGSDTTLVKDLLLQVANDNPFVINDAGKFEPKVLFMEFGDSALLFELRVFIRNIDKKFQATSDLNFAIDTVFREHNIQIPFPQRDIHIINNEKSTANDLDKLSSDKNNFKE